MPKLNQIVAVVAGKKSDAEKAITEIYHRVKKPQLFEGITKTYESIIMARSSRPRRSSSSSR